jgi:hypothetical protein
MARRQGTGSRRRAQRTSSRAAVAPAPADARITRPASGRTTRRCAGAGAQSGWRSRAPPGTRHAWTMRGRAATRATGSRGLAGGHDAVHDHVADQVQQDVPVRHPLVQRAMAHLDSYHLECSTSGSTRAQAGPVRAQRLTVSLRWGIGLASPDPVHHGPGPGGYGLRSRGCQEASRSRARAAE